MALSNAEAQEWLEMVRPWDVVEKNGVRDAETISLSACLNSVSLSLHFLILQVFHMNSQHKGTKRAKTEQGDGAGAASNLPGREQLLLTSPDLQTRLGRRFVDETELLPLLLAHGLIRRARTIQIHVRPLGGDSFTVTLDASKPTVGEAKAEIARSQGTAENCQELYRVAERADGLAVREDDAEPEPLDDESMLLQGTPVIKELPFKEPSAGLLAGLGPSLRSSAGWILDRHRLNS
jgi:hypothetical protein